MSRNMMNLERTIDRIKRMEQLLDEVQEISRNHPERISEDIEILEKIQILEEYIDNGQWLKDFECDERGELPSDLKRGVLSEDALYNLLTEVRWNSFEEHYEI